MFRAFNDELHLTKPPHIVQKIVFGLLSSSPIGQLLGYQARYEKYSGPKARGDHSLAKVKQTKGKVSTKAELPNK